MNLLIPSNIPQLRPLHAIRLFVKRSVDGFVKGLELRRIVQAFMVMSDDELSKRGLHRSDIASAALLATSPQ
jgi:hypothetical protein